MTLLRRRGIAAAAGTSGAFADAVWAGVKAPDAAAYIRRVSADQYDLIQMIGRSVYAAWTVGVTTAMDGDIEPSPHALQGEGSYWPVASVARDDSSLTYTGTWTTGTGSTYTTTTGDYVEWVTPDDVTSVGFAPSAATNCGYAKIIIDGSSTAANILRTAQDEVDAGRLDASALTTNGGTLDPTDRVQDIAGGSIAIKQLMVADNLAPGVHTVRVVCTGYKTVTATDVRVNVATCYYGGPAVVPTDAGVTWVIRKNVMPINQAVYEYAYLMEGPLGTTHWIGNHHGFEEETGLTVKVDGVSQTMTDGQVLGGTTVELISDRTQYHRDYSDATDPVGTGQVTYSMTQDGFRVQHHVDWIRALTPVTAYPAMMSCDELTTDIRYESFGRGSASGVDYDFDLTEAFSVSLDHSVGESATAWLWSPGGQTVMACRVADLASDLQDFTYSGDGKVFIQDRAVAGGTAINKVYFPLMSASLTPGTMPDVGVGSQWHGDTTYRMSVVPSADDLCSRGFEPEPPAEPVTIVQSKAATGTTVTLDAAPTPGNTLVALVCSIGDPTTFTWTHGVTIDSTGLNVAGYKVSLWSGEAQSGDSATVTVTGPNSSYSPALAVFELTPAATFQEVQTGGGSSVTSATLTTTKEGVALIGAIDSAARTLTLDVGSTLFADTRHLFGSFDTDGTTAATVSMSSTATGLSVTAGVYA